VVKSVRDPMRRAFLAIGLLILSANQPAAHKVRQTQERPQFKEPEITSAGELIHPYNSIAYGTISLEITVSPLGAVTTVQVIRGVTSLTSEAAHDVKAWTFKPATLGEKAVSSKAAVILMFNPPLNNPPTIPLPPPTEYPDEQGNGLSFSPPLVTDVTYPRYPIHSVAQGTVVLQVIVGSSGKVESVQTIRDIEPLTAEALLAVRRWEFDPATMNGTQLPSRVTVAIFFTRPNYF
jgi:TonB family protein